MFKHLFLLIPFMFGYFFTPQALALEDDSVKKVSDVSVQSYKKVNSKLVSFRHLKTESQLQSSDIDKVNINTASAEELAKKLKGVGSTRASAIIELRERLGGFSDIEQLLEVRGLGVRTLNANRHRIEL